MLDPSMIRALSFLRALGAAFVISSIAGCSSAEIARNVYEGGRAYDENLRSTPLEKSRTPAPAFDEYDRERRAPAATPSTCGKSEPRTSTQ
jgi:hypothetical protein